MVDSTKNTSMIGSGVTDLLLRMACRDILRLISGRSLKIVYRALPGVLESEEMKVCLASCIRG
jgi:hypothetical protein